MTRDAETTWHYSSLTRPPRSSPGHGVTASLVQPPPGTNPTLGMVAHRGRPRRNRRHGRGGHDALTNVAPPRRPTRRAWKVKSRRSKVKSRRSKVEGQRSKVQGTDTVVGRQYRECERAGGLSIRVHSPTRRWRSLTAAVLISEAARLRSRYRLRRRDTLNMYLSAYRPYRPMSIRFATLDRGNAVGY